MLPKQGSAPVGATNCSGLLTVAGVKEYDVASLDTFGAKTQLRVGDASYEIFRIDKVEGHERLPYSL